jgi:hypothetical protein
MKLPVEPSTLAEFLRRLPSSHKAIDVIDSIVARNNCHPEERSDEGARDGDVCPEPGIPWVATAPLGMTTSARSPRRSYWGRVSELPLHAIIARTGHFPKQICRRLCTPRPRRRF